MDKQQPVAHNTTNKQSVDESAGLDRMNGGRSAASAGLWGAFDAKHAGRQAGIRNRAPHDHQNALHCIAWRADVDPSADGDGDRLLEDGRDGFQRLQLHHTHLCRPPPAASYYFCSVTGGRRRPGMKLCV